VYWPPFAAASPRKPDGKTAFLKYVSPVQLNLQVPDDSSVGNVIVTVTNSSGSGSASTVMQAVMPGVFTSANCVLAVRPADGTVLDGTGASARPGDVLEIFGTGMGPTAPAAAAGLVFSDARAAIATPTVTIGGDAAPVSYCGLVGAGLYQINLTVPSSLGTGTYPVVVTQGGVSSPSTAVLKVASDARPPEKSLPYGRGSL